MELGKVENKAYLTVIGDTTPETLKLGHIVIDNKTYSIYPQFEDGGKISERFYSGFYKFKRFSFSKFCGSIGVSIPLDFMIKKMPLSKIIGGKYMGIPEYAKYGVLPKSSLMPTEKDSVDGFVFNNYGLMDYAVGRSAIIPTELVINNEKYCCVNVKGVIFPLVAGNKSGKKLRSYREDSFRGADLAENCKYSYELGAKFKKVGKTDILKLGYCILPEIEEAEGFRLGILIRALKSDLNCSNLEDFTPIYESVDMNKGEFLNWFATNTVQDLLASIEIGYLHQDPHQQNRLLTGWVKDYEDYEKIDKKNWNQLLATNVVAIDNQLLAMGASHQKITEIFSEVIGKNIESKKDAFLALKPRVKAVSKN